MGPNGMRTLLAGRGLVESPRWHGDRLYFSDWSAGEVLAVDLAGHSEVIARVKSLPLCTAWLPDGHLVIVSSPDGRLLRRQSDGSLVTHADLGRPGWNRGRRPRQRLRQRGGFNPMAGGSPSQFSSPGRGGRRRAPGGRRHRSQWEAVTADNSTLIVVPYRHQLSASTWRDSGLSGRRVWADLSDSVPDGICTDAQRRLVRRRPTSGACASRRRNGAAGPRPDRGGFACALGGPEREHAFIVAAEWRHDRLEMVSVRSGQCWPSTSRSRGRLAMMAERAWLGRVGRLVQRGSSACRRKVARVSSTRDRTSSFWNTCRR